jgi:hypothetical protein
LTWLLAQAICLLMNADPPPDGTGSPSNMLEPSTQWKALGRSLWFDSKQKKLLVRARIVLREGPLEHLMCLKGTKEHEAILATDAQPRQIHAGLLLTGAQPGHPVRFLPTFEPPAGSLVGIELLWKSNGKTNQADARRWIKDERSEKALSQDWVFAGSELFADPVTKRTVYAADEGDLITVANFGGAILDLPFASSANDADRVFTAYTDHIPALGSEVYVMLRPRPAPDQKKP